MEEGNEVNSDKERSEKSNKKYSRRGSVELRDLHSMDVFVTKQVYYVVEVVNFRMERDRDNHQSQL